jgi:hypothetical protein
VKRCEVGQAAVPGKIIVFASGVGMRIHTSV